MTKGYIEIDEIPQNCCECYYCPIGLCNAAIPSVKKVDYTLDGRPNWCPIKEHKEELLGFYRKDSERMGGK